MLLLEKHFRVLSIDGQGSMNQNIFVVCRRECNGSFLKKTAHQTVDPVARRKKCRVLMNGCLCSVLSIQVYLLPYNKSWWIGSLLVVRANYFLISFASLLCFSSMFRVLKVQCNRTPPDPDCFIVHHPFCQSLAQSGHTEREVLWPSLCVTSSIIETDWNNSSVRVWRPACGLGSMLQKFKHKLQPHLSFHTCKKTRDWLDFLTMSLQRKYNSSHTLCASYVQNIAS